VNQVVKSLYREMLIAEEIQPLVMVDNWLAFRPIEAVIDGRRTVQLRLWSPWVESRSLIGVVKWILAAPVFLTDLLRFCRRHRVLAFNFHYPWLGAFPIALLRFFRLYRGALILSFHGTDLRTARGAGRIERALLKWVLRRASAIVACSRGFAAEVADFARERGERVHAIHNGLDIDHFVDTVDRRFELPTALRERKFVLSISTFDDKKGLDVLLRAFVDVQRVNPGLALALVGGAGSAEPDLRALAGQLGIAQDVFFFQNVPHPQVGVFLEYATAFCLPSRTESFGIAILEAGAYRLPVVASRVGGIPEIVIDGETGLLVEPGDSEALASALNRVLFDRELASALGECLRRRVEDNFSWRRAYEEYRALLPRFEPPRGAGGPGENGKVPTLDLA
jgi:glycosyltransferase involved in cell wall biosynthesis